MWDAEQVKSLVWPDWQLFEMLGRGSFGVVYKAKKEQQGVESFSAVKVILIPQSQDDYEEATASYGQAQAENYLRNVVEDCVNEIRLMESLKATSNIVSIEDYKVEELVPGKQWCILIRMELLKGLNSYRETHLFTEKDIVQLGSDMCEALKLCKARNIIHRDIKMANIFVNEFGRFKLGDFGIARRLDEFQNAKTRLGTLNFMAPEIYQGIGYDTTVDIYSLGMVLYLMANWYRMPFIDANAEMVTAKQKEDASFRRLHGEPLPLPGGVSEALGKVICKACAFRPADRYQTPDEMQKALEDAVASPVGQENLIGQGAYADQMGQGGYAGQPGQMGQGAYAGQPGQMGQGAYAGQPGQVVQGGYAGQAGQMGQGGYAGQAGQMGQGAYAGQPGQMGQGGYAGQPGQVGQGAYAGQPGQVGQGAYAGQPGQMGQKNQDASAGSGIHGGKEPAVQEASEPIKVNRYYSDGGSLNGAPETPDTKYILSATVPAVLYLVVYNVFALLANVFSKFKEPVVAISYGWVYIACILPMLLQLLLPRMRRHREGETLLRITGVVYTLLSTVVSVIGMCVGGSSLKPVLWVQVIVTVLYAAAALWQMAANAQGADRERKRDQDNRVIEEILRQLEIAGAMITDPQLSGLLRNVADGLKASSRKSRPELQAVEQDMIYNAYAVRNAVEAGAGTDEIVQALRSLQVLTAERERTLRSLH